MARRKARRQARDPALSRGSSLARSSAAGNGAHPPRPECMSMNATAAASPVVPMRLSGLEPVSIGAGSLFVNIGERTNVTGSKAFALMILNGDFEQALAVARRQVENGPHIIHHNLDAGPSPNPTPTDKRRWVKSERGGGG